MCVREASRGALVLPLVCGLLVIAGCSDSGPSGNDEGIVAVYYTSATAFETRLGGVTTVDFDDVDASAGTVAIDADRYLASDGIIIIGEDGQYVSEDFGFPGDFPPVSSPNSYAPGPIAFLGGGNETEVTFSVGGGDGLTAGFGLYFTDADYAADGPCSLAVYDSTGDRLGLATNITTSDGGHTFRGIIMVDQATDEPVPLIAVARIVNGDGWPGGEDNEGVTLDDFMFEPPVAATPKVSGR
jgi:hypothetical protein